MDARHASLGRRTVRISASDQSGLPQPKKKKKTHTHTHTHTLMWFYFVDIYVFRLPFFSWKKFVRKERQSDWAKPRPELISPMSPVHPLLVSNFEVFFSFLYLSFRFLHNFLFFFVLQSRLSYLFFLNSYFLHFRFLILRRCCWVEEIGERNQIVRGICTYQCSIFMFFGTWIN